MFQNDFIEPEYYPLFRCKGKDCRMCCCQGWTITLNQDEYFRMQDMDCSPALKDKIEAYVGLLPKRNEATYARINLNFRGECPLRLDNGWCGLQVECGEEALPSICRYYPRAPRLYPVPQTCLSNSCEWVLEYLIGIDHKPGLIHRHETFDFDDDESRRVTIAGYDTLREDIDRLLFDTTLSLDERIRHIVVHLKGDESLMTNDFDTAMLDAFKELYHHSLSIGEKIDHLRPCSFDRVSAILHLKSLFPDFETWLTNILWNHIFFLQFPFLDVPLPINEIADSFYDCYMALVALLDANLDFPDVNAFIDVTSTYFRVAEHSNFYPRAAAARHRLKNPL